VTGFFSRLLSRFGAVSSDSVRAAILLAAAGLALCACGSPDADTPDSGADVPPGTEKLMGSERLGWNQEAATNEELAGIRYLIYVDNAPRDAEAVTCSASAGPAGFVCSSRLPSMSGGLHELTISAYVELGGTRLESPRSAPISVFMLGQSSTTSSAPGSERDSGDQIVTREGLELRAQVVVEGLDDPTDAAFASDGRIFIAERTGRVRVVRGGRLAAAPALELTDISLDEGGGLLSLAVDPDYARSRFVYLVYTTLSGFRLARVRAVGDTLGDRAILLDGVPAGSRAAAAIRFGPDRRVYLGLDDSGDAPRAGDLGSFNGKILRLNSDATTPADQPNASPVYVSGIRSPRGMAWSASGAALWVLDGAESPGGLLQSSTGKGAVESSYKLPDEARPTALAAYHGDLMPAFEGNLLVAAAGEQSVLRLTLDPADPLKITATERLRHATFDGVRAIGVAPDGAIYLCTLRTLVRLAPAR
jgi:glucose/arabinose dehydrogenase